MFQAIEITKKVYHNMMNSIKVYYKIETIFMNSENNKTPDFQRLLLNLSDKTELERSDKYVTLSNHSTYYTLKNIKKVIKKQ